MLSHANFAKRAVANKGNIYFIRTQDEYWREIYYVIQVTPHKEQAFRKAMNGKTIVDYTSFGAILARGFGHIPDSKTVSMLKTEYNYNVTLWRQ